MFKTLIAGLMAVALSAAAAPAQTIALTNATLIDGSGAPPQAGVTIVMEAGRIRDIGPAAQAPAGPAPTTSAATSSVTEATVGSPITAASLAP